MSPTDEPTDGEPGEPDELERLRAHPRAYLRSDTTVDTAFYREPRRVVHIEAGAIETIRALYGRLLPVDGPILDLMSSWRSHLPEGIGPTTGLGMNEAEMADNPQLGAHLVRDLNHSPTLPFDDGQFAGAVCTVSVQYLVDPVAVFTEVRRVLRGGAPFVVTFSNRCFPTKAVFIWQALDDAGHVELVRRVFGEAGFEAVQGESPGSPDDPVFAVYGFAPSVQ